MKLSDVSKLRQTYCELFIKLERIFWCMAFIEPLDEGTKFLQSEWSSSELAGPSKGQCYQNLICELQTILVNRICIAL